MTAIPLRGERVALDPRLDRIPLFDARSRDYTIREVLPARGSARARWWVPGPTLDQGVEGQCVSEACHDARNGSPIRTRPTVTLFEDRRAFYHECQHADPWPGCVLGAACPLAAAGDGSQAYAGTSVLTGAQLGAAAGWWREYRWVGAGSGRLEDDVVETLSTVGGIVFGIPWTEAMYSTSPSGLIDTTGPEVGGHAIHGFEWAPRQRMVKHWSGTKPGVWLHNSWGDGYGVSRRGATGCGFITLDDLLVLLERDGEGMVPLA